MPKYESNAYIAQGGKVFKPGEEIALTEEQAKRLGAKVTKKDEELSESEFRALSASEQKDLVESLGGDLEELTNQDKRAEFFLSNQG